MSNPPASTRTGRRGGLAVGAGRTSGDAVAAIIAERIASGTLAVGARLPSERQLALELGVSRPVVREALRSLIERRLVDVEPSRGAFVRGDSGPQLQQPFDTEYRRRGTTARQLSEARLMLETEAAVLAARHAEAGDLATLEIAVERLESSATPLDRVRNDLAFHIALVAAAHNPVIETMFASIRSLTVELMVRSAGDPEVIRRSEPYHRQAFEAVRARDPEGARTAMREHLGIAAATYGGDYDQRLDTMAARALQMIGSAAGLDEFLRSVLPETPAAPPSSRS